MLPSLSMNHAAFLTGVVATPFSVLSQAKTFTDPRLCAAIVDRLTFGGNIVETGTASYRLAHTRQNMPAAG